MNRALVLMLVFAIDVSSVGADVHRDCFAGQWSLTCRTDRVSDAKMLDETIASTIARTGWQRGCYEVEYIRGDAGGPDAILIVLHGRKGGSAPACRNPPYEPDEKKAAAQAAGSALLQRLGQELKKAILAAEPQLRSRLLKNTDAIEMGDGWGGQATIKL